MGAFTHAPMHSISPSVNMPSCRRGGARRGRAGRWDGMIPACCCVGSAGSGAGPAGQAVKRPGEAHRRGLAVVDAQVVLERLVDALGALRERGGRQPAGSARLLQPGGQPALPARHASGRAAHTLRGSAHCRLVARHRRGKGGGRGAPPAACRAWCRRPSRGTCQSCCG